MTPGRPDAEWDDETGVMPLPGGALVRGRALRQVASPADFTLLLVPAPPLDRPYRRIDWPDLWVPTDTADALDALHEAHRRAYAGERVEAVCRGGIGRTGTALAALAVLDGLAPAEAITWVRSHYHRRAVETPWQRRWLRKVR